MSSEAPKLSRNPHIERYLRDFYAGAAPRTGRFRLGFSALPKFFGPILEIGQKSLGCNQVMACGPQLDSSVDPIKPLWSMAALRFGSGPTRTSTQVAKLNPLFQVSRGTWQWFRPGILAVPS